VGVDPQKLSETETRFWTGDQAFAEFLPILSEAP
jgi:hypothetical protein